MNAQPGTVRLAVIDTDSGFVRVLTKRLEAAGLGAPRALEHGPARGAGRDEAERARRRPLRARADRLGVPRAGLRHAAGPRRDRRQPGLDGGAARPRPAPGRRRLDLEAVPSRGGHGAGRGRRPPPPPQPAARRTSARSSRPSSRSAPDQFQAFVAGRSINLTRREFELLQTLAEAEGKVLEREEIYQRVWGYAMAHGDRSVDVFIRKLRAKLQKHSPELVVHPHALRRRLPLRARARGAGRRPTAAGRPSPSLVDGLAGEPVAACGNPCGCRRRRESGAVAAPAAARPRHPPRAGRPRHRAPRPRRSGCSREHGFPACRSSSTSRPS